MGIHVTRHLPGATYCVYVQGTASGGAFMDKYCRQYFLTRLFNVLHPFRVQLHAYAVLENEAYLLITPQLSSGLGAVMSALQLSFGEYYRMRFDRETAPISKNITSSEVSGYAHTLDCHKFIERLAVDVGLSDLVGTWEWTSFSTNGFGCKSKHLTQHRHFRQFLSQRERPYPSYREFLASPLDSKYHAYLNSRIKSGEPITKKKRRQEKTVARKVVKWESNPTNSLTLS